MPNIFFVLEIYQNHISFAPAIFFVGASFLKYFSSTEVAIFWKFTERIQALADHDK